jgi:hypothetical protein
MPGMRGTAMSEPTVTTARASLPAQRVPQQIEFTKSPESDAYAGESPTGRRWQISPTRTGWHLEFRDPGDEQPTYAGTFGRLRDARTEANRS